MPRKQHVVRLPHADRRTLTHMVRTGHQSAWSLQRARILLATDGATAGPAATDAQVATAVGVSARTVARTRAAWCVHGLACVRRTPQAPPSVPHKLSTAQNLEIAALACTDPPPGFARWSLRLLTARVVELAIVNTVSHETVRQALKKGGPALTHRPFPDPAVPGCQLCGGDGRDPQHLCRARRSGRAADLL